jgi:hypothetical protein
VLTMGKSSLEAGMELNTTVDRFSNGSSNREITSLVPDNSRELVNALKGTLKNLLKTLLPQASEIDPFSGITLRDESFPKLCSDNTIKKPLFVSCYKEVIKWPDRLGIVIHAQPNLDGTQTLSEIEAALAAALAAAREQLRLAREREANKENIPPGE